MIEGLDMQLHSSKQKNKDLEDELCWEKNMWESAILELNGKLNKAEEELQRAGEGLKQMEAGLQKAKAKVERGRRLSFLV